MSCQSAPDPNHGTTCLEFACSPCACMGVLQFPQTLQRHAGTFFIGFFEFGQGHTGPMIPYCPGAP
ncbi:unnamed protein product, partial [Staurois parvus]